MKPGAALAAAVVFWLATATVVVVFLLGEDKPACGPTAVGPSTPLPTGSRVWPLKSGTYEISDVFGSRGGTHHGVDLAAPAGTPIYAAADGVVAQAGAASGFGQWIVIDTNTDSGLVSHVYGHMYPSDLLVQAGQQVRAGQQIARVGSNGESSGPHLHFEIWINGGRAGGEVVDPVPWLNGAGEPGADVVADATAPSAPSPTSAASSTAAASPASPGCGSPGGGGVDDLAPDTVPPDLEPWYRRAGQLCPQISSSLLASQGQAESGFRRGLTSPDGAMGLAQFMPGTATSTAPDGQPYVIDADGNGAASAWDDGDAIIGQGRYMCALAATIDGWIAGGEVTGDVVELSVAAYNAGEGAVLASGGMPNQVPRHFTETRPYVARILANVPQFSRMLS